MAAARVKKRLPDERFQEEEVRIRLLRAYNGKLTVHVHAGWQFLPKDGPLTATTYSTRDPMRELAEDVAKAHKLPLCACGRHRHWRVVHHTGRGASQGINIYFYVRFAGQPFDNGALKEAVKLMETVSDLAQERGAKPIIERIL